MDYNTQQHFQGRVALVTGASRGIGREIALAFARSGANVVVNYLSSENAARDIVEEIEKMGRNAIALQADVRNAQEVGRMNSAAKDRFRQIDILVNNAGITRDKPVTLMKEDDWVNVLDTSLKGAFNCIKTIGRDMMRTRYGKIINISSDAGLLGDVMRANYSSAKAGMIGLTKATARELAGSGVNVNAVAPGIIQTDMTAGMPDPRRNALVDMIPQRRFGAPEEVAAAVLFLASNDADYITGQVLSVDGGLRM